MLENVRKFEEARGGRPDATIDPEEEQRRNETVIVEVLYQTDEPVPVDDNVYALTIAANMTKNVPPLMLKYCLGQCILVFIVQVLIDSLLF